MKRKFKVLYTHQKTKKRKVWQDGSLCVAADGNRAFLSDESNRQISTVYLNKKKVENGSDLESDKYLIQVEEEDENVSQNSTQSQESSSKVVVQLQKVATKAKAPVFGLSKTKKSSGFVVPRRLTPPPPSPPLEVAPAPTNKASAAAAFSIWSSVATDSEDDDAISQNIPNQDVSNYPEEPSQYKSYQADASSEYKSYQADTSSEYKSYQADTSSEYKSYQADTSSEYKSYQADTSSEYKSYQADTSSEYKSYQADTSSEYKSYQADTSSEYKSYQADTSSEYKSYQADTSSEYKSYQADTSSEYKSYQADTSSEYQETSSVAEDDVTRMTSHKERDADDLLKLLGCTQEGANDSNTKPTETTEEVEETVEERCGDEISTTPDLFIDAQFSLTSVVEEENITGSKPKAETGVYFRSLDCRTTPTSSLEDQSTSVPQPQDEVDRTALTSSLEDQSTTVPQDEVDKDIWAEVTHVLDGIVSKLATDPVQVVTSQQMEGSSQPLELSTDECAAPDDRERAEPDVKVNDDDVAVMTSPTRGAMTSHHEMSEELVTTSSAGVMTSQTLETREDEGEMMETSSQLEPTTTRDCVTSAKGETVTSAAPEADHRGEDMTSSQQQQLNSTEREVVVEVGSNNVASAPERSFVTSSPEVEGCCDKEASVTSLETSVAPETSSEAVKDPPTTNLSSVAAAEASMTSQEQVGQRRRRESEKLKLIDEDWDECLNAINSIFDPEEDLIPTRRRRKGWLKSFHSFTTTTIFSSPDDVRKRRRSAPKFSETPQNSVAPIDVKTPASTKVSAPPSMFSAPLPKTPAPTKVSAPPSMFSAPLPKTPAPTKVSAPPSMFSAPKTPASTKVSAPPSMFSAPKTPAPINVSAPLSMFSAPLPKTPVPTKVSAPSSMFSAPKTPAPINVSAPLSMFSAFSLPKTPAPTQMAPNTSALFSAPVKTPAPAPMKVSAPIRTPSIFSAPKTQMATPSTFFTRMQARQTPASTPILPKASESTPKLPKAPAPSQEPASFSALTKSPVSAPAPAPSIFSTPKAPAPVLPTTAPVKTSTSTDEEDKWEKLDDLLMSFDDLEQELQRKHQKEEEEMMSQRDDDEISYSPVVEEEDGKKDDQTVPHQHQQLKLLNDSMITATWLHDNESLVPSLFGDHHHGNVGSVPVVMGDDFDDDDDGFCQHIPGLGKVFAFGGGKKSILKRDLVAPQKPAPKAVVFADGTKTDDAVMTRKARKVTQQEGRKKSTKPEKATDESLKKIDKKEEPPTEDGDDDDDMLSPRSLLKKFNINNISLPERGRPKVMTSSSLRGGNGEEKMTSTTFMQPLPRRRLLGRSAQPLRPSEQIRHTTTLKKVVGRVPAKLANLSKSLFLDCEEVGESASVTLKKPQQQRKQRKLMSDINLDLICANPCSAVNFNSNSSTNVPVNTQNCFASKIATRQKVQVPDKLNDTSIYERFNESFRRTTSFQRASRFVGRRDEAAAQSFDESFMSNNTEPEGEEATGYPMPSYFQSKPAPHRPQQQFEDTFQPTMGPQRQFEDTFQPQMMADNFDVLDQDYTMPGYFQQSQPQFAEMTVNESFNTNSNNNYMSEQFPAQSSTAHREFEEPTYFAPKQATLLGQYNKTGASYKVQSHYLPQSSSSYQQQQAPEFPSYPGHSILGVESQVSSKWTRYIPDDEVRRDQQKEMRRRWMEEVVRHEKQTRDQHRRRHVAPTTRDPYIGGGSFACNSDDEFVVPSNLINSDDGLATATAASGDMYQSFIDDNSRFEWN